MENEEGPAHYKHPKRGKEQQASCHHACLSILCIHMLYFKLILRWLLFSKRVHYWAVELSSICRCFAVIQLKRRIKT